VLQIVSLFQATTADLVARSSLAEIVDQHRSDWQQVELDTVAFTSEHAAREAVLCVTIDRLSLHDVAALSRSVAERRTVFHDQIDVERRDRLLTIEPGGVIGPFAVNGHFEVTSLVRRTRASLEDPRVVDRAQRTVIEAAIDRAARDGVTRRRHE
jgi:hypothetical protein